MKHISLESVARSSVYGLASLLACGMALFVGVQAAQSAPAIQTGPYAVTPLSFPSEPVCVGDSTPLQLMFTDLATGVPAEAAVLSVMRSVGVGGIDPVAAPIAAGVASVTYTALDDGSSGDSWTDLLTFNLNGVTAGNMPVLVSRCNYQIEINIEKTEEMEGLVIHHSFEATGEAKREQGTPGAVSQRLTGEGTVEGSFSVDIDVDGAKCSLKPVPRGTAGFQVTGTVDNAAPGAEILTLELTFDSLTIPDAQFVCTTPYAQSSSPYPSTAVDMNDMEPKPVVVVLSSGSGSTAVQGGEMTGELKVTRSRAGQP